MSQKDIDTIIINKEMTIKQKVKQLIPILMEIHQVLYKNAYHKSKVLVDVEWVKKETIRKNNIIKSKCLTDPEFLDNKRKKEREYRLRVQQKKIENTIC
jgi:hypothetical protein